MPSIGPISANPNAPIRSGSVFPSTPATNDVFFRTDRALLYYFDGTRWLTVNHYREPIPPSTALLPLSSSGNAGKWVAWSGDYDLWITSVDLSTYVGAPCDGTNYWAIQPTNSGVIGTAYTNGDTAATWTRHQIVVNALLGTTPGLSLIDLNVTKFTTPGAIYVTGAIRYRLVG